MDWEEATCDFCGSGKRRIYLKSRVPGWYEGRPLRLVECRSCGLVYASPRPVWSQLYAGHLAGNEDARALYARKLARPNVRAIHRKHVEDVVQLYGRRPDSLFDMGCGAGTLMEAARDQGIEASGNDINAVSVGILRDQGFDVRLGRTREMDTGRKFDIVVCFDYLEHTYEPLADLRVCRDILKEDGFLYLKTLFLGSKDHRRLGESWQLFGIGHFHFFPLDVLVAMVAAAGFRLEYLKTTGLVFVGARKGR